MQHEGEIGGDQLPAEARLNVRAHKVGMPDSHYQKWVWQLPAEDCQAKPEDCQARDVGNLRASEWGNGSYDSNLGEGCQS